MTAALGDDLPELHSFVTGLRRDQDAVTNGLHLPHSSGPVEGQSTASNCSKDRCTARTSRVQLNPLPGMRDATVVGVVLPAPERLSGVRAPSALFFYAAAGLIA